MTRIGEAIAAISNGITKATTNVIAVSAQITDATTKTTDALEKLRTTAQALGFTATTPQTYMSSERSRTNDEASVSVPLPTSSIQEREDDV